MEHQKNLERKIRRLTIDPEGIVDKCAVFIKPDHLFDGEPHPTEIEEGTGLSWTYPQNVDDDFQFKLPAHLFCSASGKNAVLSAAQKEAIAMATISLDQKLNDGSRRGFLLGDNTGMGKTRTLVGILYEQFARGNCKNAIYISVNQLLYSLLEKEMNAIFPGGVKKLYKLTNANIPSNSIVYTTYASLTNNANFNKLDSLINSGTLIILDEGHVAKSAKDSNGKGSKIGEKICGWQIKHKDTRFVFSSATSGYNPKHFMYMLRLGLWGPGTPFINDKDFEKTMSRRGENALEYLAIHMKEKGVFIARQISSYSIEFVLQEVLSNEVEAFVYNRATQLILRIFHAIKKGGYKKQTKTMLTRFHGGCLTFYLSLIYSSKIAEAANLTKIELENKKAVILGLQHTGDSGFKKFLEDGREGEPFSMTEYILRDMLKILDITISEKKTYFSTGKIDVVKFTKPNKYKPDSEMKKEIESSDEDDDDDVDSNENEWDDVILDVVEHENNNDEDEYPKSGRSSSGASNSEKEYDESSKDISNSSDDDADDEREDEEEEEEEEEGEEEEEENPTRLTQKRRKILGNGLFKMSSFGIYMTGYSLPNGVTPNQLTWSGEDEVEIAAKEYLLTEAECSDDDDDDEDIILRRHEDELAIRRMFHELVPLLPINPLDELADRLGLENYAEVTGRKYVYKRISPGDKTWTLVNRKKSTSFKHTNIDNFMNGEVNIAVISDAGSVGISLHADQTRANSRPRTMITLELAWAADKIIQQMGRCHRSGQVCAPKYILVKSWIPGEIRSISIASKRMATLSAICSGQSKANPLLSGVHEDVCSNAGYKIVRELTLQEFHHNELFAKIHAKKYRLYNSKVINSKIFRTFNRLLMVPIERQKKFVEKLIDEMKTVVKTGHTFSEYPSAESDATITVLENKRLTHEPINGFTPRINVFVFELDKTNPWPKQMPANARFYKSITEDGVEDVFITEERIENNISQMYYASPNRREWLPLGKNNVAITKEISCTNARKIWSSRLKEMEGGKCIHVAQNKFCPSRDCKNGLGKTKIILLVGDLLCIWDRIEDESPSPHIIGITRVNFKSKMETDPNLEDGSKKDEIVDNYRVGIEVTKQMFEALTTPNNN